MQCELMSVVILTYRRFDTVYQAIDSVLAQDYPRIELVLSDDCSPNFPREDLEEYISRRKKENLENLIINQEPVNKGTVKNLAHAFSLCGGEYIGGLAGDDVFQDEHVLSRYRNSFVNNPKSMLVMTQCAMYDAALEELQGYYVPPQLIDVFREDHCGQRLFNEEAKFPFLPTGGTMYRKSFINNGQIYDESYTIIEDVPMHLRITRENVPIHFENFISMKHRGGGISHGNEGGLKKSFILYIKDAERIHREYIKPYEHLLTPETRRYSARRDRAQTIWLDTLIAQNTGIKGKLLFWFRHPVRTAQLWLHLFYKEIKNRQLRVVGGILLTGLSIPLLSMCLAGMSLHCSAEAVYRLFFALCLAGLIAFLLGDAITRFLEEPGLQYYQNERAGLPPILFDIMKIPLRKAAKWIVVTSFLIPFFSAYLTILDLHFSVKTLYCLLLGGVLALFAAGVIGKGIIRCNEEPYLQYAPKEGNAVSQALPRDSALSDLNFLLRKTPRVLLVLIGLWLLVSPWIVNAFLTPLPALAAVIDALRAVLPWAVLLLVLLYLACKGVIRAAAEPILQYF